MFYILLSCGCMAAIEKFANFANNNAHRKFLSGLITFGDFSSHILKHHVGMHTAILIRIHARNHRTNMIKPLLSTLYSLTTRSGNNSGSTSRDALAMLVVKVDVGDNEPTVARDKFHNRASKIEKLKYIHSGA